MHVLGFRTLVIPVNVLEILSIDSFDQLHIHLYSFQAFHILSQCATARRSEFEVEQSWLTSPPVISPGSMAETYTVARTPLQPRTPLQTALLRSTL